MKSETGFRLPSLPHGRRRAGPLASGLPARKVFQPGAASTGRADAHGRELGPAGAGEVRAAGHGQSARVAHPTQRGAGPASRAGPGAGELGTGASCAREAGAGKGARPAPGGLETTGLRSRHATAAGPPFGTNRPLAGRRAAAALTLRPDVIVGEHGCPSSSTRTASGRGGRGRGAAVVDAGADWCLPK